MSRIGGQPTRHARWRHSSSQGIKSTSKYIRTNDESTLHDTFLSSIPSLQKSNDSFSQSGKYQGIASITAHQFYSDADDDLVRKRRKLLW